MRDLLELENIDNLGDDFNFTRGEGDGNNHGDVILGRGYGEYCYDGNGFSDIGAAESLAELLNA